MVWQHLDKNNPPFTNATLCGNMSPHWWFWFAEKTWNLEFQALAAEVSLETFSTSGRAHPCPRSHRFYRFRPSFSASHIGPCEACPQTLHTSCVENPLRFLVKWRYCLWCRPSMALTYCWLFMGGICKTTWCCEWMNLWWDSTKQIRFITSYPSY